MPIVSVESFSVVEAYGEYLRFRVTMSEPALDAVTMNFATLLNGTANEFDLSSTSTDSSNNGVVTIAPGDTTYDIFIRVSSDSSDERDEAITLQLSNLSANADFAGGEIMLRTDAAILDNDGTGTNRALFVSDPILTEGDSGTNTAVFEIRLSQPATEATTVSYTTSDGSAVAGQDYTGVTGSVTFQPGQQLVQVTVDVTGDTVAEASELFHLVATPPAGIDGTGAVGTARILDDDTGTGPVVSMVGSAVDEGYSHYIRYTITLSEPYFDSVSMVYRTLLNGTVSEFDLSGTSTDNYNNGTVTFAPGQTTANVFVRVTSDSTDEVDEGLLLELGNLSSPASFAGGEPVLRTSAVIRDDDGLGSNLAVLVSDPVIVEGDSGTNEAEFEIRLTRPAPTDITLSYATVDIGAQAGSDYTATSGTVTFAAGQELAYVTVAVTGDATAEHTEQFDLLVTPPDGFSINTTGAAGTATILDDDSGSGPVINLSAAATDEGYSNYLRYEVFLSETSADEVTVQYRTLLNGTAGEGDLSSNSTSNNGTVTFAPGQTSTSIYVRVTSDSADERDEAVTMQLFNPSQNASLAGNAPALSATGIIGDTSGTGPNLAVFVSDPILHESDAGGTLAVFDIRLSEAASTTMTFTYATADGTATAGSDYTASTGSFTFAPGQQVTSVSVPVLSDTLSEPSEVFSLIVTPPDSVFVDTTGAGGTATLLDDDTGSLPVLSISNGTTTEGYSNYIRYVVTLSEPSAQEITYDLSTTLGTASDADLSYSSTSGENNRTITIAAGQVSQSVFVRVTSDSVDERDESIFATVSNITGAVLAGGVDAVSAVGFILDTDGTGLNVALAGTPVTVQEDANEARTILAPVALSRPVSDALSFEVAVVGGTATVGTDFTLLDTIVTFAPGQTESGIAISIAADTAFEDVESILLGFTSVEGQPFGGIIGTQEVRIENAALFSPGNDTVVLDDTAQSIDALGGDDSIDGAGGNDTLRGGAGDDTLRGGAGSDLIEGGEGIDTAVIDADIGAVQITSDGNTITITQGADTDIYTSIEQFRFADVTLSHEAVLNSGLTVNGTDASETLAGADGNDTLLGGAGDDTLNGGAGSDLVEGGEGTDTAVIDADFDAVEITSDGDTITITQGAATDTYTSVEQFQFADGTLSHEEVLMNAGLTLIGTDAAETLVGSVGNDTISAGQGDDSVSGGEGDDIIAASGGNDTVDGGLGNDLIGGGTENDNINGGDGNDTIGSGMGDDTADGGAGNDIVNGGGGDDQLSGGDGNDTIGASFGNDTVFGNDGNDDLGGGTGQDVIDGGTGDDSAGGGEGDDTVDGGSGDDFLAGGGRNDQINGGSGNDQINGGDGSDTMTGGSGADEFIYNFFKDGDADVVTDFEVGTDKFRLIGVENTPGTGLQGRLEALDITDTNAGAQINYGGNTILLEGVSAEDLGLSSFLFL